MKSIIKNSIFIFILVATFSIGLSLASAGTIPTIVDAAATNIDTTSVDLTGIINPNGDDTTAWFETPDGGPFQTQNLGNGTSDETMLSYHLDGLTQGTSYSFRIITGNINGPVEGSWVSFTTVSAPSPSIISATATNITQTSANLNGIINPNGYDTTAWFETPSGGPFQTQNLGNGTSDVPMLLYNLAGLTPNTNYTFRVIAGNINGSVDSGWISFTTLPTSGGGSTPTLTSLSPSNGDRGETLNVTLSGSDFTVGATSDFGSDITVTSTNFISANELIADITIASGAAVGTRNVTVTSGGQTTGPQTFTVNSINPPPHGGHDHYPDPVTQNASNITKDKATLNGSINPNGYATTAWFEYGTSNTLATSSETVHVGQGSANIASPLSQDITNLSENTTYYFRAVANNTYGTKKGEILSFKTTSPENNTQKDLVVTVQATKKTAVSAQLNGIFVNQNNTLAKAYFQYGKTVSMGTSTTIKDLNTAPSTTFSSAITNLEPDTIYFFRAIAINNGLTYNGNILVFKTMKEAVVDENKEPVVEEVIEIATPAENEIDYSNIATTEFGIASSAENISEGDEINYVVNFKNITPKVLENVKITVQLPSEIDFQESNLGKAGNDNTVIFETQNMVPNQMGSMTIKGKVNSNASLKKALVTTAVMSYTISGPNINKDEIAYATNYITEKATGLEANPLFGISSLPYLLGWIALILALLAIAILVGRKMYIKNSLRKSTEAITDQVNNLDK